ncbi:MAG: hypothetical protein J7500_04645 [Sphingomonas sp.]|uniref:hypothetical protein n=1 Tax=Sphingomonas sp. TaxID=28214 RepID=UPI001B29CCC5|nr:hypothetical protein [Sphingomonas sp.]MBO9621981.1 hypothetical protein [Sphingomonas sp.]
MREPPPTRYRIVERGRRLEVIDTWNGERPVAPRPPAQFAGPGKRQTPPMLRRLGTGDGSSFTTSALYDAKGPRTLKLDYAAVTRLKRLRFVVAIAVAGLVALAFYRLWLVPVVFVMLANDKVRTGIRGAITRYLDGFQAARDSSSSG